MYLNHFGLNEMPFGITPDTDFVYSLFHHQEALNTLLLALNAGEGFLKITGEVGTGKTLLCRRLLQSLGDQWISAYIPNPNLNADTIYLAFAEELGLKNLARLDQYHLLRRINQALIEFAMQGKRVVLCVDEAQAIPVTSLEALRLLSNLETEKSKLIHVVLFGQPELNAKLARPEIRQLLQRISFHYHLGALKQDELGNYLAHRLNKAGLRGQLPFSPRAIKVLHQASRGTPRLINILAHKSLLAAFGEGQYMVKTKHVRLACKDTVGVSTPSWLLF